MNKLLFLTLSLSLCGCEYVDDTPPRLVKVCTEYTTTLQPQPNFGQFGIPMGGSIRMVPTSKCVQWGTECRWGRDYDGLKECIEDETV